MRVLRQQFRVNCAVEDLESEIAFLEGLQEVACERRVLIEETGVQAAVVGSYLIHAAPGEQKLARSVGAVISVDSLEEYIPWLTDNGAERVIADWLPEDPDERTGAPRTVTGGRNAYFRHPDGLLVEYFEPASV